jgi:hypothetical protein
MRNASKIERDDARWAEEESMANNELTPEQEKVLATPLPLKDERWQTSWSAPRPGRKLPTPLTPEQLNALRPKD